MESIEYAIEEADGLLVIRGGEHEIALDLDELVAVECDRYALRLSVRGVGGDLVAQRAPIQVADDVRVAWMRHRNRRLGLARVVEEPTSAFEPEPDEPEGEVVRVVRSPAPYRPTHRIEWREVDEARSVEVRLSAAPTILGEDGSQYRPAPTETEVRSKLRARWGQWRDANGVESWTLEDDLVPAVAVDLSAPSLPPAACGGCTPIDSPRPEWRPTHRIEYAPPGGPTEVAHVILDGDRSYVDDELHVERLDEIAVRLVLLAEENRAAAGGGR